ncbi:hypothetical protein MTO96_011750 [Rhipicephalus appendiculatus]
MDQLRLAGPPSDTRSTMRLRTSSSGEHSERSQWIALRAGRADAESEHRAPLGMHASGTTRSCAVARSRLTLGARG